MSNPRIRHLPLLMLALAAASPARADEPAGAPRPVPRFERAVARRSPEAPTPPVVSRPADLAASSRGASRRSTLAREGAPHAAPSPAMEPAGRDGGAIATRPGPGPRPPRPAPTDAEVERRGLEEGAAMAEGLARTSGRREFYRAGFHDGQRAALDDPSIGRWEYDEGVRLGRQDPVARDYGAQEGRRAAVGAARRDAPSQVESQFLDLDWKAVPSPRPPRRDFDGSFPTTPEPQIEPLFAEYPIGRDSAFAPRGADAFDDARWTPRALYRSAGRREVVDPGWQDPDRAFRVWIADGGRARFWTSLDAPAARSLFEAAFADGFLDRLRPMYAAVLDRAYGQGFEDGWRYGAFLRAEWSFRRGYAAGFDGAIGFAAEVAFERSYPAAFAREYDGAFAEWIDSARPAILSAALLDGDDDGIFQPGEDVMARYVLANYGGAAGSFQLELGGAPLTNPSTAEVRIPARARIESTTPLRARIDRGASAPSKETLVLHLDRERFDLPVRVAFPMEFTGNVSYESLPLEGRARVAFEVANRSRKPQTQVVVVRDGPGAGDRRSLGSVDAGAVVEAAFELDGVRPVELLGGGLIVRATLTAGEEIQGRTAARFPDLATRLDHPGLVAYLVRLGHDPSPETADVDDARRLLMQRLRADWGARVAEDGNSYRDDAEDGGARTALGELVRAYERERESLRGSIAWNGLDDEIAGVLESLEGAHPNLRRWAKKLAARLS